MLKHVLVSLSVHPRDAFYFCVPYSVSTNPAIGPETAAQGFGFYIVTLNASTRKLSIGGGDIKAVLPLKGDERPITAGTRSAKLIADGDKRKVVLTVSRGKLFVYSSGLSEEELLKVAASLQPIDVQALQSMVGVK